MATIPQINKHYNIMTSCDNNLTRYIAIQLYSIAKNLSDSVVDFYFFHRNIEADQLEMLDKLCQCLKNIHFHSIIVPEPEKYDAIAQHGGRWTGEAYYSLCAHQLLPDDVDRVMYIDAGDIIIVDDIAPYYNCDFEDNALIATSIRYKIVNGVLLPYKEEDLYDKNEGFSGICRGLFNSGSYIINLNKLRNAGLTIDDFVVFSQLLCELSGKPDHSNIYFGDQGFLSAAFVGDIKLYDFPRVKNVYYMPYNFCLWFYNAMSEFPSYTPAVIHFAATIKPWKMKYPITIERFADAKEAHTFRELKIGQAEWDYLWHEYAIETDEMLREMGY